MELVPTAEDQTLTHPRNEIKMALIHILAEKQAQTQQSEAALARKSTAGQRGAIAGAVGKGLWNGAVGLVEFVWGTVKTAAEIALYLSPITRINNLLEASYKTYQSGSLTEEKWRQSLSDNLQQAELNDIIKILGFDPRKFDPKLITEAYEITSLIAADAETLHLLTTFAKQYAGAQSTLDWAEFAGGGVFEIVLSALLIAFTGGVGVAAQVGSKVHHAGRLKNLGNLFRRLGEVLKRKQLNKTMTVGVDSKKKVRAELPAGAKVSDHGTKKPDKKENKKDSADPIETRRAENKKLRNSPQFGADKKKAGVTDEQIDRMWAKKAPLGFKDEKQFAQFNSELDAALDKARLSDAEIGLKGTSTTFYSENPGKPLAGR